MASIEDSTAELKTKEEKEEKEAVEEEIQEEEEEEEEEGSIRKLASIQIVCRVYPLEGCDNIDGISVLGWNLVCPKGDYKEGDLCVFFEIDSIVPPASEHFEPLRTASFRVKTRKFRGHISQGFATRLAVLDDDNVQKYGGADFAPFDFATPKPTVTVGSDCTKWLRVKKYGEEEAGGSRKGKVKRFPSFIPKTDEIRLQSVPSLLEDGRGERMYVSEKLDGSSCTFFWNNGMFGVCSRNQQVLPDPLNDLANILWKIAGELNLESKLRSRGQNLAVQGELVGPSRQSNKLKLQRHRVHIFRIFEISERRFLSLKDMEEVAAYLGMLMVPIIDREFVLDKSLPELVEMSTAPTAINPEVPKSQKGLREGLVFVFHNDQSKIRSFKVISPQFLLKHSE